MACRCPKCGNLTLGYKAAFNLWKCIRADCDYKRKPYPHEKNCHILSVFGDVTNGS